MVKLSLNDILQHSFRAEYVQADVSPLPAGHSTGWRTLPCFMFSQAGSGAEIIWLEKGRRYRADHGELILLPAGVRHKVEVASASEVRQWAHVNYFIQGDVDLFSILEIPVGVGSDIGHKVGTLIQAWVSEQHSLPNDPLQRVVNEHSFVLQLLSLVTCLCRVKADAEERIAGRQRLNPVIQHMQHHLQQPIRRDELARIAGLSPAQFHVVFGSIMQTTPMDYLRTLRLRHAQRLLLTTPAPVKEIASQSGYEDPFVFCKFFKRACGLSPSEYRERARLS
jgi:AraC-like DNA-binding protein